MNSHYARHAAGLTPLVLTALLLAAAPPAHAAGSAISEAETAIYSALINHGLGAGVPIVVVAGETTGDPAAIGTYEDAGPLVSELGLPAGALRDWRRRNRSVVTIDRALNLNVSYQVLNKRERRVLFSDPEPEVGWQQFFERYNGAPGLLRLSRVGFDATRAHGLVYVEYQCGAACGSGRLVHVERGSDDGWRVAGASLVWMVE